MKQIKIKLNYDELQALDAIITNFLDISFSTYAEKATMALLLDFVCKKIKPQLYFKFDKTKTITLNYAVCYAMMHLHQTNSIKEPYIVALMIKVATQIGPKI